jgi:flagellar hook-associated protein 2
MSDKLRITGLATGLDVDTMVKTMMKAESTKLDKLKQDKQMLQWRQDLYREILGDINTFKSSYFDVLKSDTNMLSANNFSGFDESSDKTSVATAKAQSGAQTGAYVVEVTKLATGAILKNSAKLSGTNSTKLSELGMSTFPSKLKLDYNNGTISSSFTINISADMTIREFTNAISSQTSGNITARFSELTGELTFETTKKGNGVTLQIDEDPLSTTTDLIQKLKLDTVSNVVKINGANADVFITPPGGSRTQVTDKTSNNFTIDGISYTLSSTGTANVTVTSNVQKVYDKIKTFIDKYNETIEKIQSKITEKKQYTYKPLTDEQKKDMSEDDIKKWEAKVKEGLLKGDSNLQNMLYTMRSAFFQSVEGAGVTLKEIGLSTDSDYSKGGKIVIDETKLKDAIQNKGDQVKSIFIKDYSSIPYSADHKAPTGFDYSDRSKNIGIFQRINDILKDYTRTTRDSSGKKGSLIEKAGIKGDLSEFENFISKQIKNDYDKRINDLADKLADKENKYYLQFSKLESAMNKLNSQSSWLMQQLGMGGGS